jgi:hypothetical protein
MMKTLCEKLCVVLLAAVAALQTLPAAARAHQLAVRQTTPSASAEEARVRRLAGLGKLWGTVKFFHPYLSYREIDWDKALVEAIPLVNAAKTPEEYAAAVNRLLAPLSDRETYAYVAKEETAKETAKADAKAEVKEFLRLENGVFFIDALAAAQARRLSQETYYSALQKNMALLAQAKAVVIDGRSGGGAPSDGLDFYFDDFMRTALVRVLDTSVPLGVYRYRMHNGYAPQVGGTSGGYYSASVTTAPEAIAGRYANKTPPAVFLVNERTPVSPALLSGLQASGKFVVVQDGESAHEPGVKTYEAKLPDGVAVKVRTAELLNPDGTVGFQPDEVVQPKAGEDAALKEALRIAGGEKANSTRRPAAAAPITQVSPKDKSYAEMEFPAAEYRLLALFRFWNVINYFYPYKHLIDRPWDDVLPAYIPRFEANKAAADYQLTLRELVAEIHDSHGSVGGNTRAAAERLGRFMPPFEVRFIEGRTVVSTVFEGVTEVKVGDVILEVNGEPVEKVRERYGRYIASSTPQALMRNVHFDLLRGPENGRLRLKVCGADDAVRETKVVINVPASDPRWLKLIRGNKKLPVYTVLPSGYGYVDLDRLEPGDVDKMFEAVKATPATIFDMRGYPKGTAWEIAPRLTEKTNVAAASFLNPIWEGINLGNLDYAGGTNFTFTQYLPERKGEVYKGKVVMLINEFAQSQSEHTAMFFESATDVTFIGTPTAGANGDITYAVLPGNLAVSFSGHDVRHADGRQLQRLGIQPTLKVVPTVKGYLAGRDEILEAAVEYLRKNLKRH